MRLISNNFLEPSLTPYNGSDSSNNSSLEQLNPLNNLSASGGCGSCGHQNPHRFGEYNNCMTSPCTGSQYFCNITCLNQHTANAH